MLPKFVDAPDTPTEPHSQLTIFNVYTHHSLSFAIQTAKVAAKVKKDTTNGQFYVDVLT